MMPAIVALIEFVASAALGADGIHERLSARLPSFRESADERARPGSEGTAFCGKA
jgi:hypothetical protein